MIKVSPESESENNSWLQCADPLRQRKTKFHPDYYEQEALFYLESGCESTRLLSVSQTEKSTPGERLPASDALSVMIRRIQQLNSSGE